MAHSARRHLGLHAEIDTSDVSYRRCAVNRRKWSLSEIEELGSITDLVTAGSILGMGRTKSHQLARAGRFPVPILQHGRSYVVPVAPILTLLAGTPKVGFVPESIVGATELSSDSVSRRPEGMAIGPTDTG